MPAEYRPVFLNYKLLKKQIFLQQRRACQCSIERQMQGLREVFRHPALQGRPCHLCSRPVYSLARDDQFKSTVHDSDNDATPIINFEHQSLTFEDLLQLELDKINAFFTNSMQYYVDTMGELDLMRRKEESRQNILHSGGRRFWSLKKLLKCRRRMVTLSEKMVLLDTYSFLNQAAFEKILKKHDKRTGSSIRQEYVHEILERQDFCLFTPILNDHHARCVSLVDRFPRPRRTHADRAAALHRARALGSLATAAGESVRTDHDSSVTASSNALRNQPLVQSRDVRASRCVYTRAVDVAMAAIFELYNGFK
ncbi:unnamed protein product [Sphagnum troendelagicum]